MISLIHQRLKSICLGNPQLTVVAILFPCEEGKATSGAYCRSLEAIPTRARSSVPSEEIQLVLRT